VIDFYIYDTITERELEVEMKDNELREKVAKLEEKIEHLRNPVYLDEEVRNLDRQFNELLKELGFSYDENLVFDREVKVNSSLGRLQAQISAVVDALGLEETYSEGKLVFKKSR
jgi:hypothetical protein